MKESFISPEFISQLKAKNDIVNIIGKYVRLEKKGKNFWGCCPFHHEKTPSFCINEYEQFYHCFGCGESGDVISFLRKYENLEYIDAIKLLAENAGMEMPQMDNSEKFIKQKKEKDKHLKILEIAKNFYKESLYLPEAKPAQDYIKKRHLTKRELDRFELGYSPHYYKIVNILTNAGFSTEDMKAAGVCEIGKSGKAYDFLTERLVFPIINSQGDCIGFSGRDLKNSGMMKYKNTTATLLFNKSKAIYGINLIKKLKQEKGLDSIILVEGQFDVITMHRFGFENTVACLGTAFTKDHIKELKRFADKVIICLDGDGAGQKAALRTLEVFGDDSGMQVLVAVLPNGQDPDEFLSTFGQEAMQKLLDNALTPTAFKLHILKNKYNLEKLEEKTLFVKEALKEVSKLKAASEQELYLEEIKKITDISTDFLKRDLSKTTAKEPAKTENTPKPSHPLDAQDKAIKFTLASLLYRKPYASLNINLEPFIFNPTLKKLYILIKEKKDELKISDLNEMFDVENDAVIKDVINFNFAINPASKEFFEDSVWQMIENSLGFRIEMLSKQYKEEIDKAKRLEILREIDNLTKQLKRKNLGDFNE